MNPPWQPPDPKRFRPNDPSERSWIPPPHHNPVPHQPHVHPSRQSQLPPPPPIAPYHQPPPPAPGPYYPPPPHNQPPTYPPHNAPPYYAPHSGPIPPHSTHHNHRSRNKSSDPRQRHRHNNIMIHNNNHNNNNNIHNPQPLPIIDHENTNINNNKSEQILDVLHIASDETKNFGSFAVTLSQIYGSRNMDGLPFGANSNDSIEFDGRIRSQPILSFLPEAIDTPSKKVRVYELSPLASSDKRSYDELVAFFTKNERCPVVDKEYNMGILLYFVPPKLIFKKIDPNKGQKNLKKNKKNKRNKSHKTNFIELLKLNNSGIKISDDRLWMISITSTSKYLLFKQKQKDKLNGKNKMQIENEKNNKKRKRNEADLSDIEISSDDDESDNDDDKNNINNDSDNDNINMKKNKIDDIEKSDLIVALEELYAKIGQKLPE